ncbi:MAG: phospholipase D-like domain-containing protein, partial [Bacteroidales bacterium]|nr:phospholipase D-like domain-containing protein [Bacteroidales bacterium]
MDEALKLIEDSFQKRILDKETKKKLKNILNNNKLKTEDLNFLSKKSFYLFKQDDESNIFLIDWLEDIQNLINRYRIIEPKETKVCFSPKNECSEKICKFIQKAEQSLLICVFTISDNQITKSILDAHKRGVMIKIITDNDKSTDKGSDIYQMSKQGIPIKIDM